MYSAHLKLEFQNLTQCSVYSSQLLGGGRGCMSNTGTVALNRQTIASPKYNDNISLLISQYLICGWHCAYPNFFWSIYKHIPRSLTNEILYNGILDHRAYWICCSIGFPTVAGLALGIIGVQLVLHLLQSCGSRRNPLMLPWSNSSTTCHLITTRAIHRYSWGVHRGNRGAASVNRSTANVNTTCHP